MNEAVNPQWVPRIGRSSTRPPMVMVKMIQSAIQPKTPQLRTRKLHSTERRSCSTQNIQAERHARSRQPMIVALAPTHAQYSWNVFTAARIKAKNMSRVVGLGLTFGSVIL